MNYGLIHDITEEQIHKYEIDGAVCIRGQFDQEWIDRMSVAGINYARESASWVTRAEQYEEVLEKTVRN